MAKGTPLTIEMKTYISQNISRDWKNLGRRLLAKQGNFMETESQIDNIDFSYRFIQEKSYQMLLLWEETNSSSATAEALTQALRKEKLNLYAHRLESMIQAQRQVLHDLAETENHQISSAPSKKQKILLQKHKNYVIQHIGDGWWDLGYELGLSAKLLRELRKENDCRKTSEICKKLLDVWTQEKERSLDELVDALRESKNDVMADEIAQMGDGHLS